MRVEVPKLYILYRIVLNVFAMCVRLLTMISLQDVDLAVKSMKVRKTARNDDPFIIPAYRLLSSYGTLWTISLVFPPQAHTD